MFTNNDSLKIAKIAGQFSTQMTAYNALITSTQNPALEKIQDRLRSDLGDHQERGILTVAFVGQYSAGKSTIISALTGRNDIAIDTDIATDFTTEYDWNGITIIDTPGLFTERDDHDQITYDAIERADLLVFCLTYMLFDTVTVQNFKKLAYEKGYRDKILLAVNKLSDEAGDTAVRVNNYRESLTTALAPNPLNDFPVVFVDAQDYRDGLAENDDFLIQESRFQTYLTTLNHFVQQKGALARMDTPIRLLLGAIDDSSDALRRDDHEDAAFFLLVNKAARIALTQRLNFRQAFQAITLNLTSQIESTGNQLAMELAEIDEEELKARLKGVDQFIVTNCEKASAEVEILANHTIETIQNEISELFSSRLATTLLNQIGTDPELGAKDFDRDNIWTKRRQQWAKIESIGTSVGAKVAGMAQGTSTVAGQAGAAFFKASQVSGSTLHKAVYAGGKLIGFKFKPWQAVNIAKNLGNVAKIAGPLLSVVSAVLEIREAFKDEENTKKRTKARIDLISQFREISNEIESQFNTMQRQLETELFDNLDVQIYSARNSEEATIDHSNEKLTHLQTIRQSSRALLDSLFS